MLQFEHLIILYSDWGCQFTDGTAGIIFWLKKEKNAEQFNFTSYMIKFMVDAITTF